MYSPRAHEWQCPCLLLLLQEEHLRFSNKLTLFFLYLKGNAALPALCLVVYSSMRERNHSRTWFRAVGCGWPTGVDGNWWLGHRPPDTGSLPWMTFLQQNRWSSPQRGARWGSELDTNLPDSAYSSASCGSMEQLPALITSPWVNSPPSQPGWWRPEDQQPIWGPSASTGENPSPVCWLSHMLSLGQSRGAGRRAVLHALLAWGEEERGKQSLLELSSSRGWHPAHQED